VLGSVITGRACSPHGAQRNAGTADPGLRRHSPSKTGVTPLWRLHPGYKRNPARSPARSHFRQFQFPMYTDLATKVNGFLKKIVVLHNLDNPSSRINQKIEQAAAQKAGVSLVPIEARHSEGIKNAFAAFGKERVQAVMAEGDAFLLSHRQRSASSPMRADEMSWWSVHYPGRAGLAQAGRMRAAVDLAKPSLWQARRTAPSKTFSSSSNAAYIGTTG
jgi:hypothetical protein